MTSLRSIETEMRRLVLDAMRKGLAYGAIRAAVRARLGQLNVSQALTETLLAEAAATYQWIQPRTLSQDDRAVVSLMLTTVASEFARIADKIETGILDVVSRSIRDQAPQKELVNRLEHVLGKNTRYAETIATTGMQGFNRADRIRNIRASGIRRLRYSGPGAERQFCKEHLGRIYTLDEIASLINGHGLPVLYFCGGYNCRHTWVAVAE